MSDPEMSGPFLRLLNLPARLGEYAAVTVIWALAGVMAWDVAMRGLGIAQLWASEVSVYLMLALAYLGAGATLSGDGHFRVTFLRDLAPAPVRLAMDYFAVGLTLLLSLAMCWGVWTVVQFSLQLNLTTSTLMRVPLWMLYGIMLAGCILLALAALRELLLVFQRGVRHRDDSQQQEVA
jgi:C4-dicarboxylate transporter DctQ subunit